MCLFLSMEPSEYQIKEFTPNFILRPEKEEHLLLFSVSNPSLLTEEGKTNKQKTKNPASQVYCTILMPDETNNKNRLSNQTNIIGSYRMVKSPNCLSICKALLFLNLNRLTP